jgi:hypothetical protein
MCYLLAGALNSAILGWSVRMASSCQFAVRAFEPFCVFFIKLDVITSRNNTQQLLNPYSTYYKNNLARKGGCETSAKKIMVLEVW